MPGFIDASKSDFDTLVELNANFTDGTTLDDSGDPRDPNAHAVSHATAGADAIAPADIGAQISTHQSAAADPTANNDSADTAALGTVFRAGDLWVNLTDDTTWACRDATPTAAVWDQLLAVGDIVWTGEAIATELIASGDGDTVLTAQLTNTPSGPVICHYEGTTRVQGAGECFTISGKQITWLESVGGSGTAPPMAVGENLWFFYGSTGLALGTAAYVAATSLLSAPVAPYFVSGGTPVAKASGVTVNGITDDLDQLTFHADWTSFGTGGNRTIAATALGAEFADTAGDNVYFGIRRDVEPSRSLQAMVGVKFSGAIGTTTLFFLLEDPATGHAVKTFLTYGGSWEYRGQNTSSSTSLGAADGEYQLGFSYNPISGYSMHHVSNVLYDADDGWPGEGGSWVPAGRLLQTPANEIVSPQIGILVLCSATGCNALVRNLRVRYV